jgi:hypothetical protein
MSTPETVGKEWMAYEQFLLLENRIILLNKLPQMFLAAQLLQNHEVVEAASTPATLSLEFSNKKQQLLTQNAMLSFLESPDAADLFRRLFVLKGPFIKHESSCC